METVELTLLCQRSDGKFLQLKEDRHTTDWQFVDDPEIATRNTPFFKEQIHSPEPPPYYFENSWRARELWTKDCKMVPYEIVTTVSAKAL